MKEQILRQYCSNLYLSSHIPVRIFRGEELLHAFGPSDLKEEEEAFLQLPMKALLRSDAPVSFAVTDSVFALSCVRDDENGLKVILGPLAFAAHRAAHHAGGHRKAGERAAYLL